MNKPEMISVATLNPFNHSCGGSRMDMLAKPKGKFGTTNRSGKMSTTVSHLSNALFVKGYAKAEVVEVINHLDNIHDTHQVLVHLSKPLDPTADEYVNETHLVTTRFLKAFDDIRYQE